ncbi:hypothetical protein GIB67_039191 [Kingdonia uniflora]|uniref:Myb/SANT-like domain-containing protein n=1 Tax=Kingdonia uniflora TaxID=39325 RepID=A0A7J7MM42_9MAGN|nr:hypothetical protein GIB67_039191 [Kingdonia uniflora]
MPGLLNRIPDLLFSDESLHEKHLFNMEKPNLTEKKPSTHPQAEVKVPVLPTSNSQAFTGSIIEHTHGLRTSPSGKKSASSQAIKRDIFSSAFQLKVAARKYHLTLDNIALFPILVGCWQGNKSDNGWKPKAYYGVRVAIKDKIGIVITTRNIRDRIKTWKEMLSEMRELRNLSGFGWDPVSCTIVADDEVWAALDQVEFRKKLLAYQDPETLSSEAESAYDFIYPSIDPDGAADTSCPSRKTTPTAKRQRTKPTSIILKSAIETLTTELVGLRGFDMRKLFTVMEVFGRERHTATWFIDMVDVTRT